MADGGQRLLDVIDDPNALESFLGGLTSASDLLPSAESVDTVVASLAQSLAADYEVDSPNDTLFDTLEASSNNLTDISQSYVPSDFDNTNVYSLSNGVDQSNHIPTTSQGFVATQQAGTSSGTTSTDINVEALVNSTLQQQYPTSVCDSNTSFVQSSQQQQSILQQPQEFQQQQQSLVQQFHHQQPNHATTNNNTITTSSANSFNQNFSHLAADLHSQQHQIVSRITSLSSCSSNSSNNVNCVSNSNKSECLRSTLSSLTATSASSDLISPVVSVINTSSSGTITSANRSVTNGNSTIVTATGLLNNFTAQQIQLQQVQPPHPHTQQQQLQHHGKETAQTAQNPHGICGVSGSPINVANSISQLTSSIANSIATTAASISVQIPQSRQQQTTSQPQQFIVSAGNINQLVQQGQAVSLASMTVGPQLMSSNANGGLVSNVISSGQGTNLMHIQSTGQAQPQFITVDQSTPTLIAAGGTTFGATNLALVATGGASTYAVLPTGPQIFANAIVQPQIQALKNSQTFFQTANGSLVAANSIQSLQGIQSVGLQNLRAKQPQILPKPVALQTCVTNLASASSTPNTISVSASGDSSATDSGGTTHVEHQQQHPQHSVSLKVRQILPQQSMQQVSTNSGIVTSVSNGNVSFSQPSFTLSTNAAALGQVMVSGVGNSVVSAPQQTQIAGTTIVLNQFGQPVLLPTGGASQNNGLQLILRQQPAQPQVLTIQAPAGTTAIGATAAQATSPSCKPVVRYVPQLHQNSTVQIQQIQTPNGPAFIAVRCPPSSQASNHQQFVAATSQMQATTDSTPHPQPAPAQPPVISSPSPATSIVSSKPQATVMHHNMAPSQPVTVVSSSSLSPVVATMPAANQSRVPSIINSLQQQTLASITQKTQQQITIKTERVEPPRPSFLQNQSKLSAIPDSTTTPQPIIPPPKKKPSKSKKKKVTLDLDEILKQSGIGDEDLQDDCLFEPSYPSHVPVEATNGFQSTIPIVPHMNPAPPFPTPPSSNIQPSFINSNSNHNFNHVGSQSMKPNGALKPLAPPVNILTNPHVHVLKPTTSPKNQRNNKTANSPRGAGSSNSFSNFSNSSVSSPIPNSNKKGPQKKSPSKRKNAPPAKKNEPPNKIPAITNYRDSTSISNNFNNKGYLSQNKSGGGQSKSTAGNKKNSPKNNGNSNNTNCNNLGSSKKKNSAFNNNNSRNNNNSTNKKGSISNNKSPAASKSYAKSPAKKPTSASPLSSASSLSGYPTSSSACPHVIPSVTSSTMSAPAVSSLATPSISVSTPSVNPPLPPTTSTATSTQRVVHTIQLTPQNQQLLRNIQAQINRLLSLSKRNETEQNALQKLIYLQQQVIATGTPVTSSSSNRCNNVLTVAGGTTSAMTTVSLTTPLSTSTVVPSPINIMNSCSISNSLNSLSAQLSNMHQQEQLQTNANYDSSNPNTNNSNSFVNNLGVNLPSLTSPVLPPSSTNFSCSPSSSNDSLGVISQIQSRCSSAAQLIQVDSSNSNCNLVQATNFEQSSEITSTTTAISSPSPAHNILMEKTDVYTKTFFDEAFEQVISGQFPSGSTVLVVEDPKIIEQRRAAQKAEEEARARWKKEQFEFLLKRDQDFCVEPDYKNPFTSKQDAVERLMKYHLYRDTADMNFEDFDHEFSDTAVRLLDKFACMVSKYKFLMLKESMKEVSLAERVMVERMFCNEEKLKLEQDQLLVAQGEILDLPSPPSSWMPKLKEMVEADMKELQLDSEDVNLQVQSAIDSIISCGTEDTPDYSGQVDNDKIEYDAFGIPTSANSNYGNMNSSSADIDEAVRSILA